jgi:hypothetical protein
VFSSAETGEFYRLLPAGNHTFRIISRGYTSQEHEFSLNANETKEMTISLLPYDKEFSCFPNPFTHTLHLLFPNDGTADLDLTLTDLTGREILRKTLPGICQPRWTG